MAREKDLGIETLRGIAILLVISIHAYGKNDFFSELLAPVRLPLFTAISGYLYASRPVTAWSSFINFTRKKSLRLLIPMAVCLTCMAALVILRLPGTTALYGPPYPPIKFWASFFLAPQTYWFIWSIFFIFCLVAALDLKKCLSSLSGSIIIFSLAFLAASIIPNLLSPKAMRFVGIGGFFHLMPFFLIGLMVNRFKFSENKSVFSAFLISAIALYAAHITNCFVDLGLGSNKYSMLSLTSGACSVALLLMIRLRIGVLAWIGSFAFPIYLIHRFIWVLTYPIVEPLPDILGWLLHIFLMVSLAILLTIAYRISISTFGSFRRSAQIS